MASSAWRFGTFRTVRARMLFWVLAATLPIYAVALAMSYHSSARRIEADAERDADHLAARLAAELDAVIRPIEGGVRTVASQLEEVDPPPAQYPMRIHAILAAWPEVYGATIAVEVEEGRSGGQPFAPYFFRRGDKIEYSDLALDSYGYRELPWYRSAADSRQPVWSSPYFDEGGGDIWMVTYSAPFFRKRADGQRVLAGVVTADLDLNWVRAAAARANFESAGVAWLAYLSSERVFAAPIGHSHRAAADLEALIHDRAVQTAAEAMLAKDATFGLLPDGLIEDPAYLAVRDLETLDWRLVFVIPRAELLAEARRLLSSQMWLGAAGVLLLVVAVSFVAAGVSRPIRALAEAVSEASENDPNFDLPAQPRRDEIGVLTQALRRMRDSLQRHIELRADALAAQTRLEHELQIAASIQSSMLPRPDARKLPAAAQVAATLIAAKQVGGDLYDYFMVSETDLLFVVGDVSDKGIPAALFMARLSATLRELAAEKKPPDQLLTELNARLADSNEACMFATVGCGVLSIGTGRYLYASAGHDPPLVRRTEGDIVAVPVDNGPAIGIESHAVYRASEAFLAPGDTLVLFTDGVTEAQSGSGELFGLDRLQALLAAGQQRQPGVLVRRVAEAVTAHAAQFHATDDLTVLALSLVPSLVQFGEARGDMYWRITPSVSDAGVAQAGRWIHAILAARAIDRERIHDAELIAEELLANIVRVAAMQADPVQVSLDCALTPHEIALTVRDNGPRFDPLGRESPRLDAEIAERDIGGLGIHLVRRLADACRYAYVEGCNVFEVRINRASQALHCQSTGVT